MKIAMKTTKLFLMAALALTFAACSNDGDDLPQEPIEQEPIEQPVKADSMITITAKLAPKEGGTTRAVQDKGDGKITVDWAVNEHIAILYEVSSVKKLADATITAVDGTTGEATISFSVESGTTDGTACTLVYPLSAAKDDNSGVKDAATLLGSQDGTLSANLDIRVGAGTIQTSTPDLNVTTQPKAQFAIFKFTTKNAAGTATINVKPLYITIGTQNFVITPASATSELYAALPAVSGQPVSFFAPGYTFSRASVTFEAGKYYQSTLKMTAASTVSLASQATAYTAQYGETLEGVLGSNVQISIADGAIVTLKNVTINGVMDNSYRWAGITCEGDATIILEGTNSVKGFYYNNPGIFVPEGKTLTIDGTGSLNAHCGEGGGNGYAAGIGSEYEKSSGNIVILGGTITATGGLNSAGIGGSKGSIAKPRSCGNITISGGNVMATGGQGGQADGPGIGSGWAQNGDGSNSSCGDILINGGTVKATGGLNSAGIGTGGRGKCGTITITTGVTSVTATKGSGATNSIGMGKTGSFCGTVTIEAGANVTQN
jgi:hypothetical protein